MYVLMSVDCMSWSFQETYIKALDYSLVLSALKVSMTVLCDRHK